MKMFLCLFVVLLFIPKNGYSQAGKLDSSFTSSIPIFWFYNLEEQSDHKIVLVESSTAQIGSSVNSMSNTIRRILPNGNIDTSFHTALTYGLQLESGYRMGVLDMELMPDDKILLAGNFGIHQNPLDPYYNTQNMARLHPDGTIDSSFSFNTGIGYEVILDIFINQAGEIIVGGYNYFRRVGPNGVEDLSFDPMNSWGYYGEIIESIDQFDDGKYLVGGDFSYAPTNKYLKRCMINGVADTSWHTGTGFNNKVKKVIILPNQKIMVMGDFTLFNGVTANGVCRLNNDGTLDTTFNCGTGSYFSYNPNLKLNRMLMQEDGKIIVAGAVNSFNGVNKWSVVRLLPDGSVDTTFGEVNAGILGYGTAGEVYGLLLQQDTRLIATGEFSGYKYPNGSHYQSAGMVRLFTCSATNEIQTLNACDSLTWIDGNTYYSDNNTASYTYTSIGGCDSTITLNLTITTTPASPVLSDVSACESYELPAISEGNYFSSANAGGTAFNAGDLISTTQMVYVYAENGSCSDEHAFTITIDEVISADTLNDVSACESYELPALSEGNYFSSANAGGTAFNAGDLISTTQTVYVYAENGTCSDEHAFTITIDEAISADTLDNVETCVSYELPALTSGNYFSMGNGGGTQLTAGDLISTSQMVYIYAENGACSSEDTFEIIIHPSPVNTVSISETLLTADQAGITYQWIDCANNTEIIGATAQNFVVQQNGSYAVILDNGMCTDTSACAVIADLGLQETESDRIVRVFPNPTTGVLTLSSIQQLKSIEIINLEGKQLLQIDPDSKTIDISILSRGIYIMRILTKDEELVIQQIQKNN